MADADETTTPKLTGGLLLGALGIVYGDIGTSPIYTLRESFKAAGAADDASVVLGVLSLVIWTILVIVTFKYVLLVMRADNGGEGGIIALLSSAVHGTPDESRLHVGLLLLGIFGAALFYGDGMITPAISVLSAIEGLDVATPVFHPYIVPITLVILVVLFLVQSRGSERIGAFFGPVMVVWFLVIGAAGLVQVVQHPGVLAAINPGRAAGFILAKPGTAFVTLGSVFLAVTGAEALYADMSHFGRPAIRIDWVALVLPALVLNYAGQAALVLGDPKTLDNPFFHLAPDWALYPLVVLAAAATVIASQAVISGAFSLTQQAMQLGLLPRLTVMQTSEEAVGQIYVPQVNYLLMVIVVGLVVAFKSSDNLAAAYGIAVTGTMLITTLLLGVVMYRMWYWQAWQVAAVAGPLLAVDLVFFAANALKIPQGGWFPLLVGAAVFTLMTTWRAGRKIVLTRLGEDNLEVSVFLQRMATTPIDRIKGVGIYLSARSDTIPAALSENLKHNQVLHQRVVLLRVKTERRPRMAAADVVEQRLLGQGLESVTLHVGFAEKPDVPALLTAHPELQIEPSHASFFIGRELPVPVVRPDMPRWREAMFAFMTRNAVSASDFFMIPTERVVELGTRVEL